MNHLSRWIYHLNLRPCIALAADVIDVTFDDADWEIIRLGLQGSSDIEDRWFKHVLNGSDGYLEINCSLDDGDNSAGIVHVRFSDIEDRIIFSKIMTILDICAEYTLAPSPA
ncbi:hypothetical protein JO972_16605 [Verrucomicrobiaceae bacterium 5K15]|uniref:Uncharacterized protein n=1 Tax=Oceaniferula flava TaxID=2800421 RepID=A0AAE2V970_9BACT|nr:hypothetical protein [Oceaniferula flavus]MBK1856587.1 hypothetical protein [Oceaniferula flavus]MBM1137895.1 hypothetical protein [Oceaniferula flavus]